MITRRTTLVATAAALLANRARAQSTAAMPPTGKRAWAAQIPTIRMGLLGGENDADRLARVDAYKKLMEDTFQVPVKLLVAADYAGVIQAFAAKQLDIAYMSPAAYAAAWMESQGDVAPAGGDAGSRTAAPPMSRCCMSAATAASCRWPR